MRDIEVISSELVLADLDTVEKRMNKTQKLAKSGDKDAQAELALLEPLLPHLNENKPTNVLEATDDEKKLLQFFQLLSAKPVFYACDVALFRFNN